MTGQVKKTMIYVTAVSMIAVLPVSQCRLGQLCGAVSDVHLHTHEREPGQTTTFQQITAVTTASSSAGTMFTVMK